MVFDFVQTHRIEISFKTANFRSMAPETNQKVADDLKKIQTACDAREHFKSLSTLADTQLQMVPPLQALLSLPLLARQPWFPAQPPEPALLTPGIYKMLPEVGFLSINWSYPFIQSMVILWLTIKIE